MKNWIFIMLGLLAFSCSEIKKPKDLISKEVMSQIFMENALYQNNPDGGRVANNQAVSRFILNKHKITSRQYMDSYQYYLSKRKIPEIIDAAKKKIETLDPGFKDYLKKQQKDHPGLNNNQVIQPAKYGE